MSEDRHNLNPTTRNIETIDRSDENIDDNYFLQVNEAFEEEVRSFEYTQGDTVREILDEHRSETTFWEKVVDFFKDPIQGLKWIGIRALDAFLGTRIARTLFGEYIDEYHQLRQWYSDARQSVDDIFGRGLEIFHEASEAFENAISQIESLQSLSDLLPNNLNIITDFIPSELRDLGLVGTTAYGIVRLRNDMREHPEAYENMPTDIHEQAEWWEQKLIDLGITQDTEAIVGVMTGEITLQSLLRSNEENILDNVIEPIDEDSLRPGYMPVSDWVDVRAEELSDIFSGVISHYQERSMFYNVGALSLFGFSPTFRSITSGTASMSASSFFLLAKIPYELGTHHPFGFGALMMSFAAASSYAYQRGQVPTDPEQFKQEILDFLHSQEASAWIEENNNTFDIDEDIAPVLDYVVGLKRLTDLNIEIDVSRYASAATEAAIDMIGSNEEERIASRNLTGLNILLNQVQDFEPYFSQEQINQIETRLGEFIEGYISDYEITSEDLNNLANDLAEITNSGEYTFEIFNQDGIYIWRITNRFTFEILKFNNLIIDPDLSIGEQFSLTEEFYIIAQNGFISETTAAGQIALVNLTDDFRGLMERVFNDSRTSINEENLLTHISTTIDRAIEDGGWLLVVGDFVFLDYLGEKYLVGPASLLQNIWEDLFDGGGIEIQELTAEATDGLLPVFIIGTGLSTVTNLIKGKRLPLIRAVLSASATPITVPISYFRYMTSQRFRFNTRLNFDLFNYSITRNFRANAQMEAIRNLNLAYQQLSLRYLPIQISEERIKNIQSLLEGSGIDNIRTQLSSRSGISELKVRIFSTMQTQLNSIRSNPSSPRTSSATDAERSTDAARATDEPERSADTPDNERSSTSSDANPEAERTAEGAEDNRSAQTETSDPTRTTIDADTREQIELVRDYLDSNRNSTDANLTEINRRLEALGQNPISSTGELDNRIQNLNQILTTNEPARQPYRGRSQINAHSGNIAPDVQRRVSDAETADPTRTNPSGTGRRLVQGVAGTILTAAAINEASNMASNMHNNSHDNASIDTVPEQTEQTDLEEPEPQSQSEIEVQSFHEDRESYDAAMLEFQIEAGEIARFYDQVIETLNPETIMNMDGDTFYVIARGLRLDHEQKIQEFERLVRRNRSLIQAHFEMLSEQIEFEHDPQIKISESLAVEYDLESHEIRVRYTSPGKFERTLWDNYDMIRFVRYFENNAGIPLEESPLVMMHEMTSFYYQEAGDILNSNASEEIKADRLRILCQSTIDRVAAIQRNLNTFYTWTSIAAYVSPGSGSYMDLRNAGNNFARGYFDRAVFDSIMFVGGTIADGITWGTGGTAARATKAGSQITRFGRYLDNINDSLESIVAGRRLEVLTRFTARIDELEGAGKKFYLAMIGMDLARPWLVAPELNRTITIFSPEESQAQEQARQDREEHIQRTERELDYNRHTNRTRYSSSRQW